MATTKPRPLPSTKIKVLKNKKFLALEGGASLLFFTRGEDGEPRNEFDISRDAMNHGKYVIRTLTEYTFGDVTNINFTPMVPTVYTKKTLMDGTDRICTEPHRIYIHPAMIDDPKYDIVITYDFGPINKTFHAPHIYYRICLEINKEYKGKIETNSTSIGHQYILNKDFIRSCVSKAYLGGIPKLLLSSDIVYVPYNIILVDTEHTLIIGSNAYKCYDETGNTFITPPSYFRFINNESFRKLEKDSMDSLDEEYNKISEIKHIHKKHIYETISMYRTYMPGLVINYDCKVFKRVFTDTTEVIQKWLIDGKKERLALNIQLPRFNK